MSEIYVPAFNFKTPSYAESRHILKSYPVAVKCVNDLRISETHWHNFLQIWYVISGEYKHISDGKTYIQRAGDVAFSFPYMPHSIDTSETDLNEAQVIQISVRMDALMKYSSSFVPVSYKSAFYDGRILQPHTSLTRRNKETADAICLNILSEFERKAAMHTTKMLQLVSDLLDICAKNAELTTNCTKISSEFSKYKCISDSIAFIRENAHRKITIEDVRKAAAMSRQPFTMAFKSITGKTCHDYIISERMKNAIYLLKYTRKKIPEIAEQCGFFDSSHLSKKCREFYDVSPLVFRREIGQWMREYGDKLFAHQRKSLAWLYIYDEAGLERHAISLSHN